MDSFDKLFNKQEKRYWGKYPAIVADVNDPEDRFRIRVKQNFFYGTEYSPWAEPCIPFGGRNNIGEFNYPEIGSGVWIEFRFGLKSMPIWTGYYVSRPNGITEKPQEATSGVCVKKTKHFSIIIDDNSGILKIKKNNSQNEVIITEDNIMICSDANKSIVLGEDLIEWLNNHTHSVPGVGNTSTPNIPASAIDLLSQHIKVK